MYLGVVATLRNDGTVPGRLRDELDVRDLPGKEFVGAFRFRDGSPIQTLGPALTEPLVFAWLLPDSARQSVQSVSIRVWRKKYTQLMVTYGGVVTVAAAAVLWQNLPTPAAAGSAPPHRKQPSTPRRR